MTRRTAFAALLASHLAPLLPAGADTPRYVDEYVRPTGVSIDLPVRRFTGAGDPQWTYPKHDISKLYADGFPSVWPYTSPDAFRRIDEAPDTSFYSRPKLVYHIDEAASCALTRYYGSAIADGSDVLDICSSWVSHYPSSFPSRMKSVVGTGISAAELSCNPQLSRFVASDLNAKPKLPFPDKSFDAVTCVVSFDYLTDPLAVMREVGRVLRPGGKLILSQSNRCFYTKAVGVWIADMTDAAHLRVLGNYIHFAGAFGEPSAFDISPQGPGTNDPMYIVQATRM